MSTLAVFLVLGGATAIAAGQLGRRTVGARQLKANAVTTAKIKREAVARKKIRRDAVDSSKIADGSVAIADIDVGDTPFSRVVARLRGSATVTVTSTLQVYPLTPSTYTQAADEIDTYAGAIDIAFQPGCGAPRSATAYILVDPKNPLSPSEREIASFGEVEDAAGNLPSARIEIGPFLFLGTRFEPGVAKSRTVALVVEGKCKTGGGIVASAGAVDVIGTR